MQADRISLDCCTGRLLTGALNRAPTAAHGATCVVTGDGAGVVRGSDSCVPSSNATWIDPRIRGEVLSKMQDWRAPTPVSLIESITAEKLFTIWPVSDSILAGLQSGFTWPAPSLAVIRRTIRGAADFTRFFWSPPRYPLRDPPQTSPTGRRGGPTLPRQPVDNIDCGPGQPAGARRVAFHIAGD